MNNPSSLSNYELLEGCDGYIKPPGSFSFEMTSKITIPSLYPLHTSLSATSPQSLSTSGSVTPPLPGQLSPLGSEP